MSNNAKGSPDQTPEKVLTQEDIIQLHKERFGVEPKITGAMFWESDTLTERILEAIDKGTPYVEPEVPGDVDI